MSSKHFGSLAPWSEPAWSQGIPSPYYNDSHRKLRDSLRAYINENILPYSLDWEAKGEAPRDEALKWARSGFCFADVPHPYRSKDASDPAGIPVDELDVFHTLISTDETSRVEGGVMTSLGGASVIGIPPVIHHGTDEQKRKWLPGLASWETSFCLGITEPSGGSDVANIQTTAIKSPDGKFYTVNGWKKWITGAPWATCMTTAVRTGGAGLPLIANQIIATKFSTLARYIESHWAWLEQIAYAVQQSAKGWQEPEVAGRIALAKVQGGRILEMANREAQQVLGGAGYQRGGPGAAVEQMSRDLRMYVVGGGSEEILCDLALRQETQLAKKRGWEKL
ncbi:hypothetical protein LTR35_011969 [Friedmanniomyces endolithicus]|nr:hypothetical protein LTR35_011969 [Friedmanniomyces endolithicus]